MKTESTNPRRGEIWLTAFGAGRPGEPGDDRAAVVLSADGIQVGKPGELVVVVPFSSSAAPSLLRPSVDLRAGSDDAGVAICRGIRGLARSRLLRRLGAAGPETMAEIEQALGLVLATG